MMIPRVTALALSLLLAACGGAASPDPVVSDAWVRLPAVPGRPGAAYFTVAGGTEASRLVAVESPAAGRIELHRMAMQGRAMTMQRLDGAAVPAGQRVRFAPGGDHGMVFDVAPTLKAGDSVRLDFRFERGTAVSAQARVVAAGDDAPE